MDVLIASTSWVSPGSVYYTHCPRCRSWRVRYVTRQPDRRIPYDDRGYSPVIKGDVFYVLRPWHSRSGLTWTEQGLPHLSHWKRAYSSNAFPGVGILLRDPQFLVLPDSLAFTAGEHEVLLERFRDRPPIKALKADGPYQVRTTWSAVSSSSRNGEEETRLCVSCLDKEVVEKACYRQGHLTLAPLETLTSEAQAAVSWLSKREPATNHIIFNHQVQGATVRMHSGRVSIIESFPSTESRDGVSIPEDWDSMRAGKISSPDHPEEEIVLPVGHGPWIAVHPWPQKGRD
jgi:hypothetical protein